MANFLRIGRDVLNLDQIIDIDLQAMPAAGPPEPKAVVVMMAGPVMRIGHRTHTFYGHDAEKLRDLFAGNFVLRVKKDVAPVAQLVDLNDRVEDVEPEEAIES